MTYQFTISLAKGTEHTEALVDALFEAGCDDGSVWSRDSMVYIGFSREAESLEGAIRSAIANVQRAGATAFEVTMEADALASRALAS